MKEHPKNMPSVIQSTLSLYQSTNLLFFPSLPRLLWLLVLPLPGLHGYCRRWRGPMPPPMRHMQPGYNGLLWTSSVCASCSPGHTCWHASQIWHHGKTPKMKPVDVDKHIAAEYNKDFLGGFQQGSYCKDIAASCFCVWCSWCQMHRELKYRKKGTPVIVNMQPGARNPPPAGFVSQTGVVMASY